MRKCVKLSLSAKSSPTTSSSSKSGVPILPSKRARKVPDKIQVSKEDLTELTNSPDEQSIESKPSEESIEAQDEDVSLDNLKDEEITSEEQKDSETTNS